MKIVFSFAVLILLLGNAWAQQTVDLGQIMVESSRSNDTVSDMNQSATVITADDIAKSPAKNVLELLSSAPGVLGTQLSSIKDQQVDIGGFGEISLSNTLILVDGRRLNTIDLAAPDLAQIDLNAVDHIEIIHGAGTVLYGDQAVGGVINIITKKGNKNTKPRVTLSDEVGSYKTTKEGFGLSGGLTKLAYQFDYTQQNSDGFRTDSNYWANDYTTRLNYDPTDVFGIDFSQGYHLDRYRRPGSMTIDEIDANGPSGIGADYAGEHGTTSDSYFDVTPRLKFDLGDSSGEFSIFTSERKDNNEDDFSLFDYFLNYTTNSYEFQPKLIITTPLTDRLDNKLTSGFDYALNKEQRIYTSQTGPGPFDTLYASENTSSPYLMDELTLDDHWLFNTGAREEWAYYVFNQTEQVPSKFELADTAQGYDAGLGYKYNPNSKVYFDFSHSFRLPNIDEIFQYPFFDQSNSLIPAQANRDLRGQVGNQYQLGVKDQSLPNTHLGAAFSMAQYSHEIYFDPNLMGSDGFAGINTNYDRLTRHYTQEMDMAYDLFNGRLQPFANITFEQSEFVGGLYAGNKIPFVPDQIAHAGINYNPLQGLSTSMTVNFVGKRFSISDQTNTLPKLKRYDTVDWNIKYDFRNMEIWFALRNIFNTKYDVYSTYGVNYYPAPGRNAEAGVKLTF